MTLGWEVVVGVVGVSLLRMAADGHGRGWTRMNVDGRGWSWMDADGADVCGWSWMGRMSVDGREWSGWVDGCGWTRMVVL